jgi:hypothetical protein
LDIVISELIYFLSVTLILPESLDLIYLLRGVLCCLIV